MPLSPTCPARLKIGLDVFLLLAECTTAIVFLRFKKPTTQGFRCDDISIRHTRQKDTVPTWALAVGLLLLPIIVILFSGIINHVTSSGKRDKLVNEIKACACALGRSFLLYLYGILICLIATGVLKTVIGSPRPHFIDSCNPDFSKINCSQGYIIDYTCLNQEDGVLDARRSFPSSHAALSLFMGTFLALHIEESALDCLSILLKSTLQLALLLLSTWCAWSRLFDHRHHPADVVAGSLIGILVGLWVMRIFQHGFLQGWRPQTRTNDTPTPSVGDPSAFV